MMQSLSHWGMFPCWELPGLPPMVEQPKSWMHIDIGNPYPVVSFTLAEVLTPHEDDLKLTIVKT
jgi:hypothetical protein